MYFSLNLVSYFSTHSINQVYKWLQPEKSMFSQVLSFSISLDHGLFGGNVPLLCLRLLSHMHIFDTWLCVNLTHSHFYLSELLNPYICIYAMKVITLKCNDINSLFFPMTCSDVWRCKQKALCVTAPKSVRSLRLVEYLDLL